MNSSFLIDISDLSQVEVLSERANPVEIGSTMLSFNKSCSEF